MIARLDLASIDELKEALPRFTHKPLPHLSYLKRDQIEGYWLDDIARGLAEQSSTAFVSRAADRINGLVLYGDSPWDTKVIGEPVAVIKYFVGTDDAQASLVLAGLLQEVLQHAANRGIRLLTCKVQPLQFGAIHALEWHGFLLMDTLLDFVFDFSRTSIEEINPAEQDKQLKLRRATPTDMPALMALNERSFANYFGRYDADLQMPPGTATKVYAEWVRSAFAGWADWILVAEFDGKIAGHSVWRKTLESQGENSGGVAYCDLVVVDPEFHKRGLGTALMLDGMHIARDFAQYLVGPVHVCNYAVQRTLQKLGWKISGARHSFHKWLKP
jgi:GNAT superfamily N-acetyltransferase